MATDGRANGGPLDGKARPERALLLAVDSGTAPWTVEESLDELEELTRTAGAEIVGRLSQRLDHPDPRTYFGRGKLIEARDLAVEQSADLVIVDDELAPNTQKAMEEILGLRVVDRTLLILDIFAQRARTHEGRVKVDLARLEYLLPRLTRAWTHLERQVGGIGLPGGQEVLLSDTVGFIAKLPTDLVAAFRATLEELESADLLLHVVDVSS